MSYTMIVIVLVAISGIIIKEMGYFMFGSRAPGEILLFLEKYMPMLIMVILVCFLYKDLNYTSHPHAMDFIIAGICALVFHVIFKKSYIAIILATAVFYVLHEMIFV